MNFTLKKKKKKTMNLVNECIGNKYHVLNLILPLKFTLDSNNNIPNITITLQEF